MLIGGVALMVLAALVLAGALRSWYQLARLRRGGHGVTGEVTDVDIHGYYSFRSTAPIARYVVDGHAHETVVGNYAGKAELHTELDLFVDPSDPSTVVFAYGNRPATTAVVCVVFFLVGLACSFWAR